MSVGKQDALIIICCNFLFFFLGGGRKSKNNCFNGGVQDTELIWKNEPCRKGFPVRKHVLHETKKCRGCL